MKIAEQYNRQMNEICDRAQMADAATMLELAKARRSETVQEKVIPLSAGRRKFNFAKITTIAAAFVAMFLTAGIAAGAFGYGPFASFFASKVSNPVTKKLIEDGYFMKVDERQQSDGFEVCFIGISGDRANPQIVLTMTVSDESIVKNNDQFPVYIYNGIGVEAYETAREDLFFDSDEHPDPWYGANETMAVRSEEDPNTYIIEMWGQSGWMSGGEPFVVGIQRIVTQDANGEMVEHPMHFAFYSVIPETVTDENGEITKPLYQNVVIRFSDMGEYFEAYVPADDFSEEDGIQGMIFANSDSPIVKNDLLDGAGNPYFVDYVIFDLYETQVHMGCTAAEEGNPLYQAGTPEEIQDKLHEEWVKTLHNAVIVADGTEYHPNADTYDLLWYDEEGTGGVAGRCYTQFYLPSIDFNAYSKIVLKCGDSEIILKSEEMMDAVRNN